MNIEEELEALQDLQTRIADEAARVRDRQSELVREFMEKQAQETEKLISEIQQLQQSGELDSS